MPGAAAPLAEAAPFIKWVGGKSKLLPEILGRAPTDFGRYFEPFIGGGAVFFKLRAPAAVLSDLNPDLVGTYQAVRDDVEGVIRAAHQHRELHDEGYYYATRARWNAGEFHHTLAARAAAFLYLNKTCFNGLWRVNKKGEFNVPMGRYANPTVCDPLALRAASLALRRTVIQTASYEAVLDDAGAGDFVYFDPPYDPASDTADFTAYTSSEFGRPAQGRLAEVFRELDSRGCAVMLSNNDTPYVRSLYAGFKIDRVMCARAINSRADARGMVPEVLVTNRY
jgi:DNA adenine methylase